MVNNRAYDHEQDFLRVRDFLVATFMDFGRPLNWRIERWNYARYFVAPMLGGFGQEDASIEGGKKAIRLWEDLTRVWEDEKGNLIGVVTIEHPDLDHPGFGEAFLQRHPDHTDLLNPMLDYAEGHLVNPQSKQLFMYVHKDDPELISRLHERGYHQEKDAEMWDSEYYIDQLPQVVIPESFELRSMAEDNDIENRREVFGRAFNHPDPADWPSAFSYLELQRAPDYQRDLDIYIVAPGGKHVAFCIVWYDELNRLASLEPVGTHPDFRGRGLGRAVVMSGIQRVKDLGADRVQVGSGQKFYVAMGFKRVVRSYKWLKDMQS